MKRRPSLKFCPRCDARVPTALRVCGCGHEFRPKGSRARDVRLADGSVVIWKRRQP